MSGQIDPGLAGPTNETQDVAMADAGAANTASEPYDQVFQEIQNRYENDDQESLVSDADSDYLELNAETAKLNASIEAFRTAQRLGTDTSDGLDGLPGPSSAQQQPSQQPSSRGGRGGGGRGRAGRKLGPRKAAKPTPDILYMLSLATEAFHDKRYEDAHDTLAEIIRINAETYDAWTLLSTVFDEQGERKKALNALIYAAHLTPKVVSAWTGAAAYALEDVDDLGADDSPERTERLRLVRTLYAAAVRADAADANARTALADVLMSLGHAAAAAAQYQRALGYRPLNIRTVRNLADVALDAKDPRKTGPAAREAYRRIIDHCVRAGTTQVEEGSFEWSDLRIYLEFFGIGDEEEWARAAAELKEVARWLLGRREESCWEGWEYDDCEWDITDDRRVLVPGYEPGRFPFGSYGLALPVDLRAKLCVYRLRLGQHQEAALHMQCLDPKDERGHDLPAMERFRYFPDCLKDVGAELLQHEQPAEALDYFDLYRRIAAENEDVVVDADMLVSQGRCYLAMGNKVAAEECFIGALDEDEYHIDARVELAKLYEAESEKEGREEAFLLVNEALDLEARQAENIDPALLGPKRPNRRRREREPKPKKDRPPKAPKAPKPPGEKRKYRPRRFGGSAEKQRQEHERKAAMLQKYRAAMDLRPQVATGDREAMGRWMSVAKDLVDDFRSSKQFFPWDKYVRFMGYNTILSTDAIPAKSSKLAAMAARLQQNLAPVDGQAPPPQLPPALRHDHYGIPFEEWLDLLLDYALNLTFTNQLEEAYVVLLSARDSVVFKSRDHAFLIHITWALCAVYAGDEEQCVHIARFFMRDYMPGTDSYRLFAAMVRLCQAPPSWYTSGPGQKFILRQIKLMDKASVSGAGGGSAGDDAGGSVDASQLDVCLLTIYGHILYTSQSYPYALGYFMRAASVDPTNPMINLSLGIGYIQYALKRQAPNRQYLVAQGFAFFQKYYRHRVASAHAGERQEARFNMGRAYHIIGLGHLAVRYYREVLDECGAAGAPLVADVMGREDLALEAAYNIKTVCFQMGDLEGARAITEEWLVVS